MMRARCLVALSSAGLGRVCGPLWAARRSCMTRPHSPSPALPSSVVPTSARAQAANVALTPNNATGGVQTFWTHSVVHVPATTLKARHADARSVDRRSRFQVRQRIRDDGVLSNLFPLVFSDGQVSAADDIDGVYVYELYVTRDFIAASTEAPTAVTTADLPRVQGATKGRRRAAASLAPTTGAASSETHKMEQRVRHTPAWRAVSLSLARRMAVLPPMVGLRHHLYTTAPLDEALLHVPENFWDLGWTCCELRPLGKRRYADMPASELQELVNKVVPWCVSRTATASTAAGSGSGNGGGGGHELADPSTSAGPPASTLTLARERLGKFVCTSHGITSAGLRVFRGCLVQAIFVDQTHADEAPPPAESVAPRVPPVVVVHTRTLGDCAEGAVPAEQLPVRFLVQAFIRRFVYRGKDVESYRVADASGTFLASVWGGAAEAEAAAASHTMRATLQTGEVYRALRAVRVRDFPERGLRLIELDRDAVVAETPHDTGDGKGGGDGATDTRTNSAAAVASTTARDAPAAPAQSPAPMRTVKASDVQAAHPGQLALKIDTKGTIASESTLWEEVRQHFGTGPYTADTQDRITRTLQGTPVVVSYALQQSVVRGVRFPASGVGQAAQQLATSSTSRAEGGSHSRTAERLSRRAMDPALAAIVPQLEAGQPYAVLQDHRLVPLQVLHCCFDPRMRSWQDVAIASLSFMPAQRTAHLAEYVAALAPGLARWGLQLHQEAWSTRHLSVLPPPRKTAASASFIPTSNNTMSMTGQRHPAPAAHPSTVLIMGIVPERCTADERQRIVAHAQHMAQYFRTKLVACLPGEKEAVQYMVEMLLVPASASSTGFATAQVLRDTNSAAFIVTLDKASRGTRWVMAECLSRGVLPIAVAPVVNMNRIKVLCGGLRRQLAVKFSTDPLPGVDLRQEVPSLGQRRLLLVGVDTCHTTSLSTGSIVAILAVPSRQHVLPVFWRHEARGREVQHVAVHFRQLLAEAAALYDGLDEVIVFQDGDVFSELNAMKDEISAAVPRCGLTFLCLHKRTNIRFMYKGASTTAAGTGNHNVVKGVVIPALTPVTVDEDDIIASFYLQTHESNMSTARTVQYTVHHRSPTLDITEVQRIANVTANVLAPQATKLPMCTRLAHRLSDHAERLMDAVPQMRSELIPAPLNQRLWYL